MPDNNLNKDVLSSPWIGLEINIAKTIKMCLNQYINEPKIKIDDQPI